MYQQERLDCIMEILKKYNYTTVKFLTEELHYSNATINRDLNILAKQKRIKRSYGGVELTHSSSTPLVFRYHKMKSVKNKIAKKAAEFINDGDTIFIDASTTAQYIGQHILNKKNLTVITNNLALITYLSEHNISAICLGGVVVEPPHMLSGPLTFDNAMRYKADKVFFSTGGFNESGEIMCSNLYYYLHTAMIKNSKESFYLADHDKLNKPCGEIVMNLTDIHTIISDYEFSEEIKKSYSDTVFMQI